MLGTFSGLQLTSWGAPVSPPRCSAPGPPYGRARIGELTLGRPGCAVQTGARRPEPRLGGRSRRGGRGGAEQGEGAVPGRLLPAHRTWGGAGLLRGVQRAPPGGGAAWPAGVLAETGSPGFSEGRFGARGSSAKLLSQLVRKAHAKSPISQTRGEEFPQHNVTPGRGSALAPRGTGPPPLWSWGAAPENRGCRVAASGRLLS